MNACVWPVRPPVVWCQPVFGRGLVGVTDGSAARPGEVGEIISFGSPPGGGVAFPANQVSTTLTTMGTLPAGDWDMQAWFTTSVAVQAVQLDNVPTTNLSLTAEQENALIPPGMGWMGMALGLGGAGANETVALSTLRSFYRGARAVPLVLRSIVLSPTAGIMGLGFLARRMR